MLESEELFSHLRISLKTASFGNLLVISITIFPKKGDLQGTMGAGDYFLFGAHGSLGTITNEKASYFPYNFLTFLWLNKQRLPLRKPFLGVH